MNEMHRQRQTNFKLLAIQASRIYYMNSAYSFYYFRESFADWKLSHERKIWRADVRVSIVLYVPA